MTAILDGLSDLRKKFLHTMKAEVLFQCRLHGKQTNNLADSSPSRSQRRGLRGSKVTTAPHQLSKRQERNSTTRCGCFLRWVRAGVVVPPRRLELEDGSDSRVGSISAPRRGDEGIEEVPRARTVFGEEYLIKPDIIIRKLPLSIGSVDLAHHKPSGALLALP